MTARIRCTKCGATRYRQFGTDGDGHDVDITPPCICARPRPKKTPAWRKHIDNARRLACVCQLCDEPVDGRPKVALYCAMHRAEQRQRSMERYKAANGNAAQKAWVKRNLKRVRRHARNYYRKSKKRRRARNEYKRRWRRENRDKVRAQKRRYALRGRAAEAQRRIRERVARGEHVRQSAPRNARGERLCLGDGCQAVVTGRVKLCTSCKAGQEPVRRAA